MDQTSKGFRKVYEVILTYFRSLNRKRMMTRVMGTRRRTRWRLRIRLKSARPIEFWLRTILESELILCLTSFETEQLLEKWRNFQRVEFRLQTMFQQWTQSVPWTELVLDASSIEPYLNVAIRLVSQDDLFLALKKSEKLSKSLIPVAKRVNDFWRRQTMIQSILHRYRYHLRLGFEN